MTLGVQIVAGWMGFVAIFAILTLAWAIRTGQLDDAEALSRIPFEEREPQAWPGRGTAGEDEPQAWPGRKSKEAHRA